MPVTFDKKVVDFARATLKKEKVFTLKQLTSLLGCSRRTALTKLSRWKTHTSYNQNSKYYTLPEVPQFGIHGLWWFKDIAFSKHGNLKRTIIHLVNSSESGLTGKEIGDLLSLFPQNFVHHFRHCPEIRREKHGGIYIHFSIQPDRYKQQVEKRITAILPAVKDTLSEGDAIMVLVAIIRYHGISLKEILALPEVNKCGVSELAVRNFMEFHGLLKKTPAT